MKNKLFNSIFEMELRIILLLSESKNITYTIDKVVALDFIICYAEDFDLPYVNLHGENRFRYAEISNRRLLVHKAVKELVTRGLVIVDQCYRFYISSKGIKFTQKLTSSYSKEYRKIAKSVVRRYGEESDSELMKKVFERSVYN